MSLKTSDMVMIGGGLLALGIGLYIWKKGGVGAAASSAAAAAVGVVGSAASGAVLGVGDAVGVPRTNQTECEKAIAEGRVWDASFACPASDWLSMRVGGSTGNTNNGATGSGGVDPMDYGIGNGW